MTHNFTDLETEFQAAKLRLQAAQQEQLEAAAEFLAVRAALRQRLQTVWPAPCPCKAKAGDSNPLYSE